MSESKKQQIDRIRECCDGMLANAQAIRIQQVQATNEAEWSPGLTEISDDAWRLFNQFNRIANSVLDRLEAESDSKTEAE